MRKLALSSTATRSAGPCAAIAVTAARPSRPVPQTATGRPRRSDRRTALLGAPRRRRAGSRPADDQDLVWRVPNEQLGRWTPSPSRPTRSTSPPARRRSTTPLDRPGRRAAVHRDDHASRCRRAAVRRDGGHPPPGARTAARGRRGQLLQGRRAAPAGAAGAAGRRRRRLRHRPSTPRASPSTRTATTCRTCWSCVPEVPGAARSPAAPGATTPTGGRCRPSAAARTRSSRLEALRRGRASTRCRSRSTPTT